MGILKDEMFADTRSKIGALIAKPAFRRLKKRFDQDEVGGAPLLGVNGVVVKAHGSSNAKAFKNAIFQAKRMVDGNVVPTIAERITRLNAQG